MCGSFWDTPMGLLVKGMHHMTTWTPPGDMLLLLLHLVHLVAFLQLQTSISPHSCCQTLRRDGWDLVGCSNGVLGARDASYDPMDTPWRHVVVVVAFGPFCFFSPAPDLHFSPFLLSNTQEGWLGPCGMLQWGCRCQGCIL